ncbi:MAG: MurR/RpiR family transcriptional regulator [Oscillospiraceae bacterium]|nr:MurR/RpiR family transcriptional regulator [Oscillospiraceae bacterium]
MPQSTRSVIDRIREEYYDLTTAEKKTADYVLGNPRESQFLSIAELAEESGVAEATVSRFCRRLGYKGYNAFKLAIANATAGQNPEGEKLSGQIEADDSMEDMCRKLYSADVAAVTETLNLINAEQIRRGVRYLADAGKVLCMGQGGSMVMAQEAAHLFSTVSGKFFAVSDSHLQIISTANMTERDVLLFFSYSGATRDLMEALTVARERHARIILVTRFARSPGAEYADLVLCCGSNESPLQLSSVPAKLAQLFLLDVLFTEYCRRDLEACNAARERVASALAEKHL